MFELSAEMITCVPPAETVKSRVTRRAYFPRIVVLEKWELGLPEQPPDKVVGFHRADLYSAGIDDSEELSEQERMRVPSHNGFA
jgi:hypothetical protein